ncbi:hypothetical protein Lalb_Chr19g0131161 [Lupinus albus]|uniref:Uncharacterized protein n=1 Tax=Lupinus albus TaxID=3870 RepID=A0A6A4P1W6_LUPAL|nr:hypothetical protein Lalb_Chr19g0131161 [Lupinus albus]
MPFSYGSKVTFRLIQKIYVEGPCWEVHRSLFGFPNFFLIWCSPVTLLKYLYIVITFEI